MKPETDFSHQQVALQSPSIRSLLASRVAGVLASGRGQSRSIRELSLEGVSGLGLEVPRVTADSTLGARTQLPGCASLQRCLAGVAYLHSPTKGDGLGKQLVCLATPLLTVFFSFLL